MHLAVLRPVSFYSKTMDVVVAYRASISASRSLFSFSAYSEAFSWPEKEGVVASASEVTHTWKDADNAVHETVQKVVLYMKYT